MNISFAGAAGEVTGSCNLVQTDKIKLLIDCGMFQGGTEIEQKNSAEFDFDPKELHSVIITHAHLDHVGRLPLLIRNGYDGQIYATKATTALARLILEDALKVMQENYRRYGTPVLYDSSEVAETVQRFVPIDYGVKTELTNGDSSQYFIFHDAGHIFGSVFVELFIDNKKVVFSGDVGNTDVPILKDTEVLPDNLDLVVCESTYGGRIHEARTNEQRENLIEKMVVQAINRGGVLMIPSFALERTQQLLYVLNDLIDRKRAIPRVPIFLDSPLAIEATEVYRNFPQYYDQDAIRLYQADDDLFDFPGLTTCLTREESKKINHMPGGKIIIAGAGMMNGGRIIHHALRYLSDSSNTLLFVGYQAKGTLGRKILEGVGQVEIMKEKIPVNCHIQAIGALSAHADQQKILDWLGGAKTLPKKVVFNHGEPEQAEIIARLVSRELNIETQVAKADVKVEV